MEKLVVQDKERTKTGSLKGVGGRPPGAKNKTTILKEAMNGDFQRMLKANFREIVRAVVEQARDGDLEAAKFLIDKVVPKATQETMQQVNPGGIQIIIGDMQPKKVDGEVIENDV